MTEYQAKIWHDYSNTTTPITANDLNKFEDGIETAINGVNELSARVQALESLDERLTIIEEKGIQSDTLTSIWAGTQSQYGALGTYSDSTLYIISG